MSPNNPYSSISHFIWPMEPSQDPEVSHCYYSVTEMGTALCGPPSCYSVCLFFCIVSSVRLDRRRLETGSCAVPSVSRVVAVTVGPSQHHLSEPMIAPHPSAPHQVFPGPLLERRVPSLHDCRSRPGPKCTVLLTVHMHQRKHWLRAEHHAFAD